MVCIWVAETDEAADKGLLGTPASHSAAVLKELDPEKLRESLGKITSEIGTMLDGVQPSGGFSLDQFEIGIEINGEAGISLVGTAKVGGKAAITLSFKRIQN